MAPRRHQPSALLTKAWILPGIGLVKVFHPSGEHLTRIDEDWPPKRRETDWHHAWRWAGLTAGTPEAFIFAADSDHVLGIWCSAKQKPIVLPEGRFYRPDKLEISPDARGGEVGAFLFLLIASRALELGAEGIVLSTWPVHRAFYVRMGGVERRAQGWNVPRNLVPFVFDLETLQGLKALLDAKEHDGEGSSNL